MAETAQCTSSLNVVHNFNNNDNLLGFTTREVHNVYRLIMPGRPSEKKHPADVYFSTGGNKNKHQKSTPTLDIVPINALFEMIPI